MEDQIHFDLGLGPWSEPIAKRVLGLAEAERLYSLLRRGDNSSPAHFCKKSLEALGVSFELPHEQLHALRQIEGPLILAANHPLGVVDALVLMVLMGELRPDFKFMGNSILTALPELAPVLVPVHIMGEAAHAAANFTVLKSALRYLKGGGLLGLFPAGEVALTAEHPWHEHLGRLVKKSQATVVPLFFEDRNSPLFRYLGLVVPPLRLALLAREMLRFKRPVRFKLGSPVAGAESAAFADAALLTLHLRRRTLGLCSQ